jgi:hypothetical protein
VLVEGSFVILAEERRTLLVAFNKFFLLELRKILWKHRISAQEFLSYVIKLLVTGDQRVYDILMEAKRSRAKEEIEEIVHTDEESLYNLIEHSLVSIKKTNEEKKERGKNGCNKKDS